MKVRSRVGTCILLSSVIIEIYSFVICQVSFWLLLLLFRRLIIDLEVILAMVCSFMFFIVLFLFTFLCFSIVIVKKRFFILFIWLLYHFVIPLIVIFDILMILIIPSLLKLFLLSILKETAPL